MVTQIREELDNLRNPDKAKLLARFFKTGKGDYGEGDIFLGVMVPQQRKVAKKYKDLPLKQVQELVTSKFHEHRLTAFMLLDYKYQHADDKKEIFEFYMKNRKYANNWDIIDVTAPKVVGDYLLDKDKSVLYMLARSKNLWEKRIAIISTAAFIRDNQFKDTIRISEILLKDNHGLIHKAVGWMLREVGKKDEKVLLKFLEKHCKKMPRTMLRYSIERLSEKKRKYYLLS